MQYIFVNTGFLCGFHVHHIITIRLQYYVLLYIENTYGKLYNLYIMLSSTGGECCSADFIYIVGYIVIFYPIKLTCQVKV